MQFRAHIRFDFGDRENNEYNKLIIALIQAGWSWVETSALTVETSDFSAILRALEVCARQVPWVGDVTGLLIDVQGSDNFSGKSHSAEPNHRTALRDILARPLPSQRQS